MDNQTASRQLHSPHKLQVEWHLAYHNETLRAAMHSQTRFANVQFLRFVQHVFGFFSELRGWSPFFSGLCKDWVYAHVFFFSLSLSIYIF